MVCGAAGRNATGGGIPDTSNRPPKLIRMSISLAQFRKQLTTSELKPVYLLAGEEHLLLLEAADALRARARELGYAEREILDVETHFDWNALAQASASMSLFAARKLIDLRMPTGKPGREGSAAIVEYCENPSPDNVLLITCTQWSKQQEGAWVPADQAVPHSHKARGVQGQAETLGEVAPQVRDP